VIKLRPLSAGWGVLKPQRGQFVVARRGKFKPPRRGKSGIVQRTLHLKKECDGRYHDLKTELMFGRKCRCWGYGEKKGGIE